MLEVTRGSMTTIYDASDADFPAIYACSELRKSNDEAGARLAALAAKEHAPLEVAGRYAASAAVQRWWLLRKFTAIFYRSPHYSECGWAAVPRWRTGF